jgi:hypothetical protein
MTMSSFMLLIVILVGLSVFSFSDPIGFTQAFVPFSRGRDVPSSVAYSIGVFLMLVLGLLCFMAGGLTTCLTLDLVSCPFV